MRTAIFATAALLTLSACSGQPSETEVNRTAATALFDAFNNRDVAALSGIYADDARLISPETSAPIIGPEAIAENYAALFAQIPDVHDALETVVAEGHTVAVTFTASSDMAGFALPIAAFFTFSGGKIVEDKAYFDTETAPEC